MLDFCRLHRIGLRDWDWWMWARSLWAWVLWWPDQWLLLFLWEGMDWKKLWNWYWWLHGKAMSEWGLLQWSSTWLSVSMSTSVQRKELWDWYQWVWSKPMSGKVIFISHFFKQKIFQNGGGCVNHVPGYFCICKDGFNGTHCETNIDDCRSISNK